ncbi:MAG: DEAD/DEAH box helicase family protein, partial [Anaerolineae bacterium]|nr:DEAD/DEAH box helicase family protein [Anaerolineae bacterium]NIQ78123.1 DEAD/DEAH box helicase family protein [Anaerolineae bacterium]
MRELYPFQVEGVDYLLQRKSWGKGYVGGMLWDDPGLGKTTQAIVAAHRIGEYPVLVVCPNALKLHWAREIRAIVPGARVTVATVGGRFRKWSQSAGKTLEVTPSQDRLAALKADWVIVHYAGIRISQAGYASIDWSTVIIDEAHYIKNRNAARTRALMEVTPDSAHRIGLTATPWSKEPSGLWSQLHWMAPQVDGLSNYWRWFGLFVDFRWEELRDPKTGKVIRRYRKVVGGKNLDALAEVMSHYGRCRTKEQVAPQLPSMTRTRMPLELSGRQKV